MPDATTMTLDFACDPQDSQLAATKAGHNASTTKRQEPSLLDAMRAIPSEDVVFDVPRMRDPADPEAKTTL